MSRTAVFLAGGLLVLLCAACTPGYEAGSDRNRNDSGKSSAESSREASSRDNAPSRRRTGSRAVPQLDVCREVTSDSARIMMGLPSGTEVDTTDVSDREEGIPPNLACRYSWREGDKTARMRISIIPDNDLKDDPQKLLKTIVGSAGRPFEGVGEAAGFDKGGYAGEGVMVFGATERTRHGLTSVSVYAPVDADERVLAEASAMLLGRLRG